MRPIGGAAALAGRHEGEGLMRPIGGAAALAGRHEGEGLMRPIDQAPRPSLDLMKEKS
jgi:hypothetical protein